MQESSTFASLCNTRGNLGYRGRKREKVEKARIKFLASQKDGGEESISFSPSNRTVP